MNLKQLEAFVRVSERRSFSKAVCMEKENTEIHVGDKFLTVV